MSSVSNDPKAASTLFSMTGFGQAETQVPGARISVEVKSVNHRYLDATVKAPREYAALEPRLLEMVRGQVKRGKVDVFVSRKADASDPSAVRADIDLAKGIHRALEKIAGELGLDATVKLDTLSRWHEIVAVGATVADIEAERAGVESALKKALEKIRAMRADEGKRLADDVRARIGELRSLTAAAKERAPKVVEDQRAKLKERLARLLGDSASLDPGRLEQEVAMLADRADVHEELVRLESHLQQLDATLAGGGEVGRRLDFLLQEVGRETNTLGSKANDIDLGKIVVELKAVAERIREQAANLE